MLTQPDSISAPRAIGASNLAVLLSLVCLGLVLGGTTLFQTFHVLPYPNLFIRWCELAITGLFLFTTARSYQRPSLHQPLTGWLLVLWLGAAWLSVALAVHPGPALIRQAEWTTHLLFAVALWGLLRRDALSFQVILTAIPIGFILFTFYLLSVWLSMSAPRDYNWFFGTPLIGHARHLGYYALVALLFSTAPLLGIGRKPGRVDRILALLALTICWGALFWTGGRAALGSGVVGMILLLVIAPPPQRRWLAGVVLAAAGLGLGLSVLFLVNDPRMGFLFSLERTVSNAAAHGVDGFTNGRLSIWRVALEGLEGHWLFGLGPDGYRFIPAPHHGIQPHGMLVQFIVEWGVIGASLFGALLALVFRTAYVRLRQEQDRLRHTARAVALAVLVAATLHALVDGLYYHAQPLLFLFTCFALTLQPLPRHHPDTPAPASLSWLTSRRLLLIVTALLALFFILSSNTLYKLFTA